VPHSSARTWADVRQGRAPLGRIKLLEGPPHWTGKSVGNI
jgi:hypothetical protein